MTETTQQQPTTAEPARAPEGHKAITSTQRVLDAVRDLRELDQIATRETVAELTGLKMGIVDDRLRALVDDGKLKRLLRGVYELVETYPEPRELSCTMLSTGWVKLYPRPIRAIAKEFGVPFSLVQGIKAGITYKTSASNPVGRLASPVSKPY